MDKQKQIEEMANIMLSNMEIPKYFKSATEESDFMNAYKFAFICYATHLYNAGCRIMNENAVVLTREEYEKLKDEKADNILANVDKVFKAEFADMKNSVIRRINKDYAKKVRKETVDKFAERVKTVITVKLNSFGNRFITIEDIDEIAKEFTEVNNGI